MKDERKIADLLLDGCEGVELQALPVCRIEAVDVADAAGEEVDAEVSDDLALLRICDLAHAGDAVLGTADAADLSLDGDALLMGKLHELRGVLDVDVEGLLVGAIVHDGREASVHCLEAGLIGAVVEVKRHRNRDVHILDEVVDDSSNDVVAALILCCTHGALDDQRGLLLLSCGQDCLGPLEVVGVESTKAVVALLGGLEHVRCIDKHCYLRLTELQTLDNSDFTALQHLSCASANTA